MLMPKNAFPNTVSFSVKGQVVIPRNIRKQLEIEEGTRALISVEGNKIILTPLTQHHFKTLRGLLKGS